MKFILLSMGLFFGFISSSYAAVSATVSTALGDAATDVGTVGALVLVAIVAAATFKYIRRAL